MDSNSVQVLTTNPELAGGVADVISAVIYAIATVFAALVAIYGINSWRREFKGKRQIELAEDVLALFYEARDAITAIRSPFSYEGEGNTRKAAKNETEGEKKVKDRAYTVWERYKKYESLFNKLLSMRYRFMSQVGEKNAEPFEQLRKIVNEILIVASSLGELWFERQSLRKPEKKISKTIKEYEAIFWWQGSEDDISKRVDKIVADMDKTCKKIIMRK